MSYTCKIHDISIFVAHLSLIKYQKFDFKAFTCVIFLFFSFSFQIYSCIYALVWVWAQKSLGGLRKASCFGVKTPGFVATP